VRFSGVVEKLQKQVEELDPNSEFGTWLQAEKTLTTLGWNVQYAADYIKDLDPAERKQWLLEALEATRQQYLEREGAQKLRNERRYQAIMMQRSLPESVDKILRYETAIDRQLYRAIAELEKLQAGRRRMSTSSASGPTRAS